MIAVAAILQAATYKGLLDEPVIEIGAFVLRYIGKGGQVILVKGLGKQSRVKRQPAFNFLMLWYPLEKVSYHVRRRVHLARGIVGQQAEIEGQATRKSPEQIDTLWIIDTALCKVDVCLFLSKTVERNGM